MTIKLSDIEIEKDNGIKSMFVLLGGSALRRKWGNCVNDYLTIRDVKCVLCDKERYLNLAFGASEMCLNDYEEFS